MRLRQTCSVLNVYRVNKDHMCSLRGWSKYTYSVMFVYLRGDRTDVYVTVLVVCVKFMYCCALIPSSTVIRVDTDTESVTVQLFAIIRNVERAGELTEVDSRQCLEKRYDNTGN